MLIDYHFKRHFDDSISTVLDDQHVHLNIRNLSVANLAVPNEATDRVEDDDFEKNVLESPAREDERTITSLDAPQILATKEKEEKEEKEEMEELNESKKSNHPIIGSRTQQSRNHDTLYREYLETVYQKIARSQHYPAAERRRRQEGRVTMVFKILQSGSLDFVHVQSQSGYSRLDQAALKAIKSAAPFSPFPSIFTEKELVINMDIIFKLQ